MIKLIDVDLIVGYTGVANTRQAMNEINKRGIRVLIYDSYNAVLDIPNNEIFADMGQELNPACILSIMEHVEDMKDCVVNSITFRIYKPESLVLGTPLFDVKPMIFREI